MFRSSVYAIALLLLPLCVFAYTSVIAKPEKASTVLQIENVENPQEFFGRLDNFPHTFDLRVTEPFAFEATIFVHDSEVQKNDVSIILVKKERRGVSEIGRTASKEASWERERDHVLVESFRKGGSIAAELQEGEYTLEVSSPNNDGIYRLRIGNDVKRNYFDALRVLFEVKALLGSSPLSYVLSPLIYVPFLLLLVVLGSVLVYRKRR